MKGSRTSRNDPNKSLLTSTQMSLNGFTNGPIKEVLDESQLSIGGPNVNVFDRLTMDAKTVPEKKKGRE